MGSDSIPREHKPRSDLCTCAFHLTFMSQTGKCRQQKHNQHAPSRKTEYGYLHGWVKKRSHTPKISPIMVNPGGIAGNAEEEEEEEGGRRRRRRRRRRRWRRRKKEGIEGR